MWHCAYPESLGVLGPLFEHAGTFPWNIISEYVITDQVQNFKQFRLFLYPCVDLGTQWELGQQLKAIHASSKGGSLIGRVLHESHWDDWFLSAYTYEVLDNPGYGLLVVPRDNSYWTDEHAATLRNERVYVNEAYPSISLDQVAEHLATGLASVMEEIDREHDTLEQWMNRNEAMVTRRAEIVEPVTGQDYQDMKAHIPALLEAAQRSYDAQYD
jgi:hypothetical protein